MVDPKDADTQPNRIKAAWLWKVVKFESLSIMVLLFALLYSNGYAYLETYNLKLGVPVNRLGYDTYQFVVYGGIDILVKLGAMLFVIAGGTIFALQVYFTENPDRVFPTRTQDPTAFTYRLGQRLKKSYTKARMQITAVLLITLLTFLAWGCWKIAFSQSIERGKLNAYQEIRDCKPSTLQLNNLDVVTGCIVGESDDMLYLIEKHSEGKDEITFKKQILPKQNLRSTSGMSTLTKPR